MFGDTAGEITYIIYQFFISIILLTGIIFLFTRGRGKKGKTLSLSKRTLSQLFILLSLLFGGMSIWILNTQFEGKISNISILLIVSILGFCLSYYFQSTYTLFISLISGVEWWFMQSYKWMFLLTTGKDSQPYGIDVMHRFMFNIVYVTIILIMFIFYIFGRIHERNKRYKSLSKTYLITSLVSVFMFSLFFSTQAGLGTIAYQGHVLGPWQVITGLLLLLSMVLSLLIYGYKYGILNKVEVIGILFYTIFWGLILNFPMKIFATRSYFHMSYAFDNLTTIGALLLMILNISVFLQLVGLILVGYMREENWIINISIFFLFITVILDYFDWFYSSLNKSVFFIGMGLVILGIGVLMEKGRRYVLSRMKQDDSQKLILYKQKRDV